MAGLVCAITLIIGVTAVYPSVDDLWVENPFWNGLSEFYKTTKPWRVDDDAQLESVLQPSNSTLFILGPSTGFTDGEAQCIQSYLGRGGTVVLTDDTGTGNQLLSKLELPPLFQSGKVLKDPLFRDNDALMPVIASVDYPGIKKIVLNYATSLRETPEARVTARSSPFSYMASAVDEAPSKLESSPIVAEIMYGEGRILLISDSSVFINSMIGRGDNRRFLQLIAEGQVMIDEAHSIPSRLATIKTALTIIYTALGNLELRYGLALILVAGIMMLQVKESLKPVDPVETIMRRHPEYDRELVQRLHEEREKAHGDR